MSSNDRADDLWDVDFARDVPTTPADVEALWKARELRPLSFDEYVAWVTSIVGDRPRRSVRLNPDADEPFEL